MTKADPVRIFGADTADSAVQHQMSVHFQKCPIGLKEDDIITLGEEIFYVLNDNINLLDIEATSDGDIKVDYQAWSPHGNLHMFLRKVGDLDYDLLMAHHHVDILREGISASPRRLRERNA
jgi:hypothetical protein